MTPFVRIEGTAIPLPLGNVDTDLIIPARYLKTISRRGLGEHAFAALRGTAGNPFDDPRYRGAPILVALDNFGCGSSREHAVWALAALGIRAVIAPSFSDIFAGNAFRNGIAAVELMRSQVDRLLAAAPGSLICVDLEKQIVTASSGDRFEFSMDAFRRECLMTGRDEIEMTLGDERAILDYERRAGI